MAKQLTAPEPHETLGRFKTSPLIRALDAIASGLGLLLLAPVLLGIALAIKIGSPGPVFYRAERVGRGGRVFTLFKFRSMVPGADRTGPGITQRDDPRVTAVGRVLRRTKLDELPQLVNVLRGEMSLVGPRPEDPRYVALYTPTQRQLLSVRPGITSPASFRYRDEERLLSGDEPETVYLNQVLPQKLAIDLAYLERRTVWSDVGVLVRTVTGLVGGKLNVELILQARNRHFFVLDVLVLSLIPALALTLRLERLDWWRFHGQALVLFTGIALAVKLPVFYSLKVYNRYWRCAGIGEVTVLLAAVALSTGILVALMAVAQPLLAPRNLSLYFAVPLIDGLVTALYLAGVRFGVRGLHSWHTQRQPIAGGRRTLVVGAGESGALAVQEMRAHPQLGMEPVAFVAEDPKETNTQIEGLPVLGDYTQITGLVEQHQIQRIVVALPTIPYQRQIEIIDQCRRTGVSTQSLPGIYEILAGYKTVSPLPHFDIIRLLHRAPVDVDTAEVAACLQDAAVLVTGAGGSIGSELCRQIARYRPAAVILLGHGENSIAEIGLDLKLSFPDLLTHQVIADVRDGERIRRVFERFQPTVVFHAAAHKHVPLMEHSVEEAVTNNILGTQCLVQAAERSGVSRFVMISTDKAVHPSNVMGATKRIAELLVIAAAQRSGYAYQAVRFGNVLGSRGSVVPIFLRQIASGGPVTVTHPEMRRYFMTIPEAVQLVLQAAVLGHGGEIFVLDMGEPVRIVDLAMDLVRLSGLKPERDIRIVYVGVRPGEKLEEALFLETERHERTKHPRIFAACGDGSLRAGAVDELVAELVGLARQSGPTDATERLRRRLIEACQAVDGCPAQPPAAQTYPESAPASAPKVSPSVAPGLQPQGARL